MSKDEPYVGDTMPSLSEDEEFAVDYQQHRPNVTRERSGSKWRWQWEGWTSPAFEYLEVRPWTPQVIGGLLCFSACESGKWYVIHGDDVSIAYDDAYDITEWRGKPLYIARQSHNQSHQWFLVWGGVHSQSFPFQITYQCLPDKVMIVPFKPGKDRESEMVTAEWQ